MKPRPPSNGLSVRANHCLARAGIPAEKEAVVQALRSVALWPYLRPRNYGKKTHEEVCRWAGVDPNAQLAAISNLKSDPIRSDGLGMTILKGACNSKGKDLAVELGEIGLDRLLSEGVLKQIPVLKIIIACLETWKGVREQLFLRKVAGFLSACPKFTEAEREAFVREHLNDTAKAKKLSDAIVLILDKLDDLEKPEMVSKAFAAVVRGKIPVETFRRLAAAIDIGFVEDLKALGSEPFERIFAVHHLLVRTGLVQMSDLLEVKEGAFGQSASARYQLTELGNIFIGCMNEKYDFSV